MLTTYSHFARGCACGNDSTNIRNRIEAQRGYVDVKPAIAGQGTNWVLA